MKQLMETWNRFLNESNDPTGNDMTFSAKNFGNGEEITIRMGVGGLVNNGQIQFVRVFTGGMRGFLGNVAPCRSDFDKLIESGNVGKFIYYVSWSKLPPELQGKGLGKKMYAGAFAELRKAIGESLFVMPNACEGRFPDAIQSATSPAAKHVWDSLAKNYPSSGRVIFIK